MLWALIVVLCILTPILTLFAALCGLLGRLTAYCVLKIIPNRERNPK